MASTCPSASARRLLFKTTRAPFISSSSLQTPPISRTIGVVVAKRNLHGTPARRTDGVFHGLTDTRERLPWIEAFRRQQEGKDVASDDGTPAERDMSPKRMSDSYHRVVLPLGQDPSLSDVYINSSGHIRYLPTYLTYPPNTPDTRNRGLTRHLDTD